MTPQEKMEYEKHLELMRKWNEQRAKAEEEGLAKFRRLKEDKLLHPTEPYRSSAETFYGKPLNN